MFRAAWVILRGGELQGHDYAIGSIIRYQLYLAGREKFYFDFSTSAWRVDGNVQNADERRNLCRRIPGSGAHDGDPGGPVPRRQPVEPLAAAP